MFFDFAPRRAFDFEKKTFTRRITNNSLLHVTKQFLLYLNSLDWSSAFDFRIWFAKTLIAFDFDEKLTQRVAHVICNITCQKTFFPCTLRLIRCFQSQGMIWKTEECRVSKNIALKTWRWKSRIWFFSAFPYFADLKTIHFVSCLCCSCRLF